jgi:hypothetical protein
LYILIFMSLDSRYIKIRIYKYTCNNRRIVGSVVFSAVRVVWKECRRLFLFGAFCLIFSSFSSSFPFLPYYSSVAFLDYTPTLSVPTVHSV